MLAMSWTYRNISPFHMYFTSKRSYDMDGMVDTKSRALQNWSHKVTWMAWYMPLLPIISNCPIVRNAWKLYWKMDSFMLQILVVLSIITLIKIQVISIYTYAYNICSTKSSYEDIMTVPLLWKGQKVHTSKQSKILKQWSLSKPSYFKKFIYVILKRQMMTSYTSPSI